MPPKIKKIDGYQVSTPEGITAKRTTKIKAERQASLLRGIEHGWHPTGAPARTGNALRNAVMGSSKAVVRVAKSRAKKKKGK